MHRRPTLLRKDHKKGPPPPPPPKNVISNEDVKRDDFPVSFRFAIVAGS